MDKPRFGLIGVAGFVAPRHLKAIREVGGTLCAAVDPNDSVGIMDSFFPDAQFFTEFERFDLHVHELRRADTPLNYVSICSPNYLHRPHVSFALRAGADAICEKPLVLTPSDLDDLGELERESGRRVNTILQLRLHPAIVALRDQIARESPPRIHEVQVTYITGRGRWYHASWKGEAFKSGGIATNIGVHLFDMLGFIFGPLKQSVVHSRDDDRAAGYMEFEHARVRWLLSINTDDLPPEVRGAKSTFRSITVDGDALEFSDGFTDLHTASYEAILKGEGFGLNEVRPSIETVYTIRTSPIRLDQGEPHPLLQRSV